MSSPFGFVIIDKPTGLTSHDCVNRLRKIFEIRRVGHGGVLDPAVTGVLPIALGNATRLLPYLPGDKTYKGIIQLGKKTNTDDLEGKIIEEKSWPYIERLTLEKNLEKFRGTFQQTPPQVSNVHFRGVKAHIRARRGESMELPAREITIHELILLNWNQSIGQLEVNVHCSSGTYIRSLARDLGEALGCGACLAKLRRTQALGFLESQAFPLPNKIEDELTQLPNILTPIKALHHLPRLQLQNSKELKGWRTGQQITVSSDRYQKAPEPLPTQTIGTTNIMVILDIMGDVAGIANIDSFGTLIPKVVFNAEG